MTTISKMFEAMLSKGTTTTWQGQRTAGAPTAFMGWGPKGADMDAFMGWGPKGSEQDSFMGWGPR